MGFHHTARPITCYPTMPYEELQKKETALCVGQIMAEVPDNLREILLLSCSRRFSYKQMTEIRSIPIVMVNSKMRQPLVVLQGSGRSQSGAKRSND
jgi:DNA-directed RNA polymerase specialized sigma24 family protein